MKQEQAILTGRLGCDHDMTHRYIAGNWIIKMTNTYSSTHGIMRQWVTTRLIKDDKKIAWLDLQLQQTARQLHLQKPCSRWKVQDNQVRVISNSGENNKSNNFQHFSSTIQVLCAHIWYILYKIDSSRVKRTKLQCTHTQTSRQHTRTKQTTQREHMQTELIYRRWICHNTDRRHATKL